MATGTGRKRPLEPPQATEKGDDSKRKDGKSKKKRKRSNSASKGGENSTKGDGERPKSSSRESTTTAEGRVMAQVLSTFSRVEQSRFEAFRRSTFASDSIRNYVAHCLVAHQDPSALDPKKPPELAHLCAPGQAEDITIIVSTVAKVYAQRLVTAARAMIPDNNTPIQPSHILAALRDRQAKGLDPGFFLPSQPPLAGASTWVARSNTYDKEEFSTQCLAAQYYQQKFEETQAKEREKEESKDGSKEEGDDDKMEISPAKEGPTVTTATTTGEADAKAS